MKNLICPLIFLSCSVAFSYSQPASTAVPQPAENPNAPEITFEEMKFDFGEVKKGEPIVHKFKFKNTGKQPLIINKCKAGCGCTTPTCPVQPVHPGKTGFIEVHYDSMKTGTFIKEITIESNAKSPNVFLVISGNVKSSETQTGPALRKEQSEFPVNKNE